MRRNGESCCSYQLEQNDLGIDRVGEVIVIPIDLGCNDLGMIADDLSHTDLHADGTLVTDKT
jgi:hypothetical protein